MRASSMPVGTSGRGPVLGEQSRAREARRQRDREHEGQERKAGSHRREAERLFEVVREEQEDSEDTQVVMNSETSDPSASAIAR